MNKKIIKYLLLLFFVNAHSQKLDNLIFWSKEYKISYQDFLGVKKDSSDFATARSALQTRFIYNKKKKEGYNYYIYATFDMNKSFTLSNDSITISHEQFHFDLEELLARKIRKKILALRKRESSHTEYLELFSKHQDTIDFYHGKYDLETARGHFQKIQQVWNKKISKDLEYFESFSAEKLYGPKKD